MAQIPLGALTTLNLSTQLDPMFSDLYPIWTATAFTSGKPSGYTLEHASYAPAITFLKTGNYSYSFGGDTSGASTDVLLTFNALKCLRTNSTLFAPGADNTSTLGSSTLRWSTVYAVTGTINTSDARNKTAVQPLSPAELAAAKALSAEVGTFRFLDAVAAKGADARQHAGMTVQRAMQILQSQGLDPMRYAFICHDSWPASDDTPAGDRYGFRTDELLLFIARGFDARLATLEAA